MTAPTNPPQNPFAAPQGDENIAPSAATVPPQYMPPQMGWMPPPPPKKKAGAGKIVGLTVLGLIVFGGCVSAIGGGGETDKVVTSSAATDTEAPAKDPVDPAKAAADKAAADKAAADKAAAEKAAADKAAADKAAADKKAAEQAAAEEAAKGTPSQQQAYSAAIDYLEFSAFSRAALIGQLSSKYGSQFPVVDAEFAVARIEREGKVDWNEQAARAAKEYLEFSSFSRQGLLDQLTSKHGSQFTQAQAEYGVNQTGL